MEQCPSKSSGLRNNLSPERSLPPQTLLPDHKLHRWSCLVPVKAAGWPLGRMPQWLLSGGDLASPKLGSNRQNLNLPQGCALFVSSGGASSSAQQLQTATIEDKAQTKPVWLYSSVLQKPRKHHISMHFLV